MGRKTHLAIVLACCLWFAQSASAASGMDEHTPTFYINAFGGLSTYESAMIKSQTSSTMVGYGFGVYAGRERTLGMSVGYDQSVFDFQTAEIPSGKIDVKWQDMVVKYRWGPLYIGAVIGSTIWVAERLANPEDVATEVEEYINVSASGFGANLGLQVPVGRDSFVYLDVVSLTPTQIQKAAIETAEGEVATDRTVAIGNRLDIDLGGSFGLTKKLIDGTVGLKRRTVAVTVDGETFAELQTTTYLGVRFGWEF